ncbi:phosphoethanolamine transferase [Ectopseudomonas guguanensis]|nr:phosphoethanolamine transferase [Pseudomonas guguanensis]
MYSSADRRLAGLRPSISVEGLIAIASVFFVATANGAFWSGVRETGVLDQPGSWRLLASAGLAIAGLHAILLGLVLNRWTVKPLLTLLLMATAAAAYFADRYAVHLDPSMIRNVLRTDTAEALELLTPGLALSVLALGVLPSALVWWTQIRTYGWKRSLARRLVFLLAVIALTGLVLATCFDDLSSLMRNHKSLRYLIAPGNYLVSIPRVLGEDARVADAPRRVIGADARLVGHGPSTKPHLLVIVVGETVRAQNWGLSGYRRQTTPQLSSLDVINFTDVTACGSNTEVSVPCMFSATGRRNYDQQLIRGSESLLHVLERAGIRTLWRDNQTGCKGVCAGLAFESYREPRADPLCDDQACRDAVMLQGLHDAIDDNPGDVVVVLHQLGNHGPSYFKRYPPSLRRFVPDCRSPDLGKCSREEIVNAYDNAILETDDFLARTIRMLAQDRSHDTAMIYLSDHGESLGEGNLYLHGFPYAIAPETQIKVPMVVWISPGMRDNAGIDVRCVKRQAGNSLSHDNLFHSVLGLMQVRSSVYDPDLDVFSECIDSKIAP